MTTKSTIFIVVTSLASAVVPGLYGVLGSAGFYLAEIGYNPKKFDVWTFLFYCAGGFITAVMMVDVIKYLFHDWWAGALVATGYLFKQTPTFARYILDKVVK